MASLEASGLVLPGGLATSAQRTGHQWDYPNAWAPLQYLVHEGLTSSGGSKGRDLASKIAKNFLRNVHATLASTGQMHEKYNAEIPGQYGGGGEYTPQTGFGWTNGVVLRLLLVCLIFRRRSPRRLPIRLCWAWLCQATWWRQHPRMQRPLGGPSCCQQASNAPTNLRSAPPPSDS